MGRCAARPSVPADMQMPVSMECSINHMRWRAVPQLYCIIIFIGRSRLAISFSNNKYERYMVQDLVVLQMFVSFHTPKACSQHVYPSFYITISRPCAPESAFYPTL